MTNEPAVYRCTNFGGYYRDSNTGGSGVEYYSVVNLGVTERGAAQNLGLPKRGAFHIDPNLAYIGFVQFVEVVQEFGPLGWLARVYYSVGGTFNFSLLLGMTTGNDFEMTDVPLIHSVGTGFIKALPRLRVPRYCITKRITSRSLVSLDEISSITADNLGKIYTFDGKPYQLCGAPATQDQGANIRVDTRFRYRGPLSGYSDSSVDGFNKDVPALPANCDWIGSTRRGTVTVTSPPPDGGGLPWLP